MNAIAPTISRRLDLIETHETTHDFPPSSRTGWVFCIGWALSTDLAPNASLNRSYARNLLIFVEDAWRLVVLVF